VRGPMAAGRPTALFKRTESPARSAPSPASHAGLQRGRRRGGQGGSHGDAACPHSGARQGSIPRRPVGWWRSSSHSPLRITGGTHKGTQRYAAFPSRAWGVRTAATAGQQDGRRAAACRMLGSADAPLSVATTSQPPCWPHAPFQKGGDHAPPTRTPRSKILARGGCAIPWRPAGRRRPLEWRLHQDARRVALAPVARRTPRRQAPVNRPPGPPAPAVSLRP